MLPCLHASMLACLHTGTCLHVYMFACLHVCMFTCFHVYGTYTQFSQVQSPGETFVKMAASPGLTTQGAKECDKIFHLVALHNM